MHKITADNCVLLVCNYNYLKFAHFACFNLFKVNDCDFQIVIATDKLPPKAEQLDNVSYYEIQLLDFIESLPQNKRLQQYTYWRLPAIEQLASFYKKILYLDIDIFIDIPILKPLFNVDFCGAVIAAVLDVHQKYRSDRMLPEFKKLNMPLARSFNAGVLLVDCEQWLQQKIFDKILVIAKENKDALLRHDQSLLNIALYENWLEISPVWNWQQSIKSEIWIENNAPHLIHICGDEKFWDLNAHNVPRKMRAQYADAYKLGDVSFYNIADKPQLFNRLLKNIWYYRANKRYYTMFPTIETTYRIAHKQQ